MKKLSKDEMKKVVGGMYVGGCAVVFSDSGQSSCWYTNDPADLCFQVYGSHCNSYSPGSCFEGCILN